MKPYITERIIVYLMVAMHANSRLYRRSGRSEGYRIRRRPGYTGGPELGNQLREWVRKGPPSAVPTSDWGVDRAKMPNTALRRRRRRQNMTTGCADASTSGASGLPPLPCYVSGAMNAKISSVSSLGHGGHLGLETSNLPELRHIAGLAFSGDRATVFPWNTVRHRALRPERVDGPRRPSFHRQ